MTSNELIAKWRAEAAVMKAPETIRAYQYTRAELLERCADELEAAFADIAQRAEEPNGVLSIASQILVEELIRHNTQVLTINALGAGVDYQIKVQPLPVELDPDLAKLAMHLKGALDDAAAVERHYPEIFAPRPPTALQRLKEAQALVEKYAPKTIQAETTLQAG